MTRRSFFHRLAAGVAALCGAGSALAPPPPVTFPLRSKVSPELAAMLRAKWEALNRDPMTCRTAHYKTALNGGWMTINDVRALEGRA